jgi:signal transduction histidine kinase
VESEEGRGSTFSVSLPLGSAHLPAAQVHGSEARPITRSTGLAQQLHEAYGWSAQLDHQVAHSEGDPPGAAQATLGARVLLVEDNPDLRDYLRGVLVRQGWDVDAVSDGSAALERLEARRPDLVLADVMMPGIDGFELMRRVKARLRGVPVILLSARAGEEAVAEGISQGADDYLVKPFSARELVARVSSRLEVSMARAEAIASRERLHAQIEQAPVAMAVLRGPELIFELANPLYQAVCGRNPVGKSFREAFPELIDTPAHKMLQHVFESGRSFSADEYRVLFDRSGRGNGPLNEGFFQFTCQAILEQEGKTAELMVVLVEVTEQVRARQRAEALSLELRMADERKDDFLATLAHELRNPMAAISVSLAMLERGPGNPAMTAKHQAIARRQMSNLSRLTEELLDVSRITRDKVSLVREEVDFTALVQNAINANRPALETREQRLQISIEPDSFLLSADPLRIEQVVSNLLTNAIKYTPVGGQICVELSRGKEPNSGLPEAVLRVKDTGQGIPADMLGRVFELFVQVSPRIDRSQGGLGLGLTLVKKLVELHGGKVEAFSAGAGKGSEFVVHLPLPAGPGDQAGAPAAPAEAGFRRQRILLVEDSEDLRDGLRELLESLGHEVETAKDGLEGASRLLELKPDVALVDVGLPGIDGYEVARRVRAQPEGVGLYLVALTGYGSLASKAQAEAAGFNLHLTKPIDPAVLPGLVEHHFTSWNSSADGAATKGS